MRGPAIWLATAALGPGCGEPCVEVPDTCTPQYDPTFDQVYANTITPSCALSGCHGGDGDHHGMDLSGTADDAWSTWVDQGFVAPGEPGCGPVVARLESTGEERMPPGAPLSDEERCAIRTWIADGAQR